jgi:hypothetical protein
MSKIKGQGHCWSATGSGFNPIPVANILFTTLLTPISELAEMTKPPQKCRGFLLIMKI